MKSSQIFNLAQISLALGDSRRARELARHILAHLPGYMEAHLLLAPLLLAEGEEDEARRHWEAVLALDPLNFEALSGLRLLPLSAKSSGEGGKEIVHTLALAESLWREERWSEANKVLVGLEERYPSCLRVKLLLAHILLRGGDEVAGADLLHQAQILDPSQKLARELLGDLCPPFDLEIPTPEVSPEEEYHSSGEVAEEPEDEAWPPDSAFSSEREEPEEASPQQEIEFPKELGAYQEASLHLEPPPAKVPFIALEFEPVELIITSKGLLLEKYGSEEFAEIEGRLNDLGRATEKRMAVRRLYVDDADSLAPYGLEPVDPKDPWQIKALLEEVDGRLQGQGMEVDFLLIVGGDGVIPFCRLPNPTDDQEGEVCSDAPYASRGEGYLPERAVGRLPDGKEGLLLSLLEEAIEGHREGGPRLNIMRGLRRDAVSFGLSAEIWKAASQTVFQTIGPSNRLEVSPPFTDQDFLEREFHIPPLAYFNLHGLAEAPYWYGHQAAANDEEPSFPIALTPLNLFWSQASGAVVFTEACYGARLGEGSPHSSMALGLLAGGARGVVGSTGMAYGSLAPPLSGADLLALHFWRGLKEGLTMGEALLQAKLSLVREMVEGQGFLDGEDQKTVLSFVLYGDPSLRAKMALPRSKGRVLQRLASLPCPSIICGRKPQRLEVAGEVMAKVRKYLEEKVPLATRSELKVAYQALCGEGCDCNGKCFLKGKGPGEKAAPVNLVFTAEQQAPVVGDGTLRQLLRITTDPGGNVLKVAVSR